MVLKHKLIYLIMMYPTFYLNPCLLGLYDSYRILHHRDLSLVECIWGNFIIKMIFILIVDFMLVFGLFLNIHMNLVFSLGAVLPLLLLLIVSISMFSMISLYFMYFLMKNNMQSVVYYLYFSHILLFIYLSHSSILISYFYALHEIISFYYSRIYCQDDSYYMYCSY